MTLAVAVEREKQVGRRFYEPELDALRFFTFLAVFCFHAVPSSYDGLVPRFGPALPLLLQATRDACAFGVCMFFLLSSYLITKLLFLERRSTGSVHLPSFYVRRILRIWPLYIGFLLVMWWLGRLHVFSPVRTSQLAAFLLFAGNIYSGRHGFSENPILPLWTISIEEQFYIIWPFLARWGGFRVLRVVALLLIPVAMVGSALIYTHGGRNPIQSVWASSVVHFQFFALGGLLGMHFAERVPQYQLPARAAMLLGGCGLLVGASVMINGLVWRGPLVITAGYELLAAAIVLIFLSVLGLRKELVPAKLIYLGKISFGLYVFHVLSLQVCKLAADRLGLHRGFRFGGALAMTVLLAVLSYEFFEKPFLVLKKKFTFLPSRAV